MAENDLAAADSLISQAEALGVQYNMFYMGDTPKKARRDLERKRNASAATPTKPSQLFAPLGSSKSKKAPTTDPFAGRPADSPAGARRRRASHAAAAESTPPTRSARFRPQALADAAALGAGLSDDGAGRERRPRARRDASGTWPARQSRPAGSAPAANQSPLRAARLALAVGDVRRAAEFVQQAKGMRVNYQPLGRHSRQVEAAIRKYQELSSLDKNTEAYRRAYARNMMEQADALLRWGEQDEAERLAGRAAGMRIVYGPFEQKPQDLLERIAAARRQGGGRQRAAAAVGVRDIAGASAAPAPTIGHAPAGRRVGPPGPRGDRRRPIGSGRIAGPSGRTTAAARLRLCAGRGSSGAGAVGPAAVAAARVVGRGARRRTVRILPAVATASPTAPPHAPSTIRPTTRRGTCRRRASSRPTAPTCGWRRTPAPRRPGSLNPPPPPDPQRRRRQDAGHGAVPAGRSGLEGPRHRPGLRIVPPGRRQHRTSWIRSRPSACRTICSCCRRRRATKPAQPQPAGQAPSMADEAAARQQVLARQVAAELAHKESNARALRDTDPKGALAMLEEARKKVEASGLDSSTRDQLLRRVDRAIAETKQFIEQNRPQIELAEKNNRIRQDVERRAAGEGRGRARSSP